MQKRLIQLTGGTLAVAFMAACAVGPNYRRPEVASPAKFRSQGSAASDHSLADLPWWKIFRDEALQGLIHEALEKNHDLRIAVARMEQARGQLIEARSEFFPQIGLQGDGERLRSAKNGLAGNDASSALPQDFNNTTNTAAISSRSTTNRFNVAGTAAWEIDLWGRIRRTNEAALANYFASEDGRRGVVQSLVAEVAQSYFQLRELDLELEIARRTRDSFNESLDIFKKQKEGGIASDLEVSRAAALRAQAGATIPELDRQISVLENRLSLLLGRNPGAIRRGTALVEQQMPPEVPAGLPSKLLLRRPDLRSAEEEVVAANAEIGVAVAQFLPKIDLTSTLGAVSPQLRLLTAGKGDFWNLGGSLTAPLFEGGRLYGNYREAKAHWEETRAAYQRTAISACVDVSNALISRQKYLETRTEQEQQVTSLRDAVRLARSRYTAGMSTYIELLDAQQQLFPAEQALAQTRLNQLLAIVHLYKALGGGWVENEPVKKGLAFHIHSELPQL